MKEGVLNIQLLPRKKTRKFLAGKMNFEVETINLTYYCTFEKYAFSTRYNSLKSLDFNLSFSILLFHAYLMKKNTRREILNVGKFIGIDIKIQIHKHN